MMNKQVEAIIDALEAIQAAVEQIAENTTPADPDNTDPDDTEPETT